MTGPDDCLFLALAEQNDATFVSFDKKLIKKGAQLGIKTISVKS